jgi:hypothetical protein
MEGTTQVQILEEAWFSLQQLKEKSLLITYEAVITSPSWVKTAHVHRGDFQLIITCIKYSQVDMWMVKRGGEGGNRGDYISSSLVLMQCLLMYMRVEF